MTMSLGRRLPPAPSEKQRAYEAAKKEAWDEYLETCRKAEPTRYLAVEMWAWNRLQAALDRARTALTDAST